MARINSRQVEAFRAMMLTGSVTEAAKLMNVTQPAVSRLLRDFQALLKMELFEKRGTGLVPVAAATALYMEVERSFVGLERITATAEEIRSRRTGTLRIAALPALANGFLPRLLRAISDGAAEPQSIVLWRDLTDRGRLGDEQPM